MGDTTTRVEALDFKVEDHASSSLGQMTSAFKSVSHAAEGVGARIKDFAKTTALGGLGAVGLGLGLRELAWHAKEANLELEGAAKKVAGAHFAFGQFAKGTTALDRWKESMEEGLEVVEKLDVSEGKLKIKRVELANIYAEASLLGAKHNQSQAQMIELTEKLGATQKVLGISAQGAAMTISRAAMFGMIRPYSTFNQMLIKSVGDMKKFHKMSESQRFDKLKKAMGDLVPAAQEMGTGMQGAIFDIKESVEQGFRDLTGPLFKEQTKSLRDFAKHITEVREGGQSIMQVYGQKLVTAFHALQKASKFIADHWKEIAAAYVAMKAGGWITGAAGRFGGVGALVDYLTSFRLGVNGSTASLATFAGKLVTGVGALAGFYVALKGGAKWIDEWQTGKINAGARWGDTGLSGSQGSKAARKMQGFRELLMADDFIGNVDEGIAKSKETFAALQAAFGTDTISKGGKLDPALAREAYQNMTPEARERMSATGLGLSAKASEREFVDKLGEMVKMLAALLPKSEEKKKITDKKPPVTNIGAVHITQEFKEADPDRVFQRVLRDIESVATNPTGASTGALSSTGGGM